MAENLPGKGLWGWLGRQFGHVKKAVKTDVRPEPKVVYRDDKVEEADMPGRPGVKLRRTVIDEVIVAPRPGTLPPAPEPPPQGQRPQQGQQPQQQQRQSEEPQP